MASEKNKADPAKKGRAKSKTSSAAKEEPLNLFEDQEKKAARREQGSGANAPTEDKSIFKPLSQNPDADLEKSAAKPKPAPRPAKKKARPVLDLTGESDPVKEPEEESEPAEGVGETGAGDSDGDVEEREIDPAKIIHLKPPIIVKDLADAMDVKAFKLMKI